MRCILILNQKTTAPFNAPRSLRSRLCTVILYARIPLCFRYQHQLPQRELNRLQTLRAAAILRPVHVLNTGVLEKHQSGGHETLWLGFLCKDSPSSKSAKPGKFWVWWNPIFSCRNGVNLPSIELAAPETVFARWKFANVSTTTMKFARVAFIHTKFGLNQMNSDCIMDLQSSSGWIIYFLLWQ